MANHVSALKRARQTETRTEVNRANRSRVRTSLRALREAMAKGDVKAAQEQYRATVSALDKSVQKGVLHSNTVSRYKSRLNARLKTLATTGSPPRRRRSSFLSGNWTEQKLNSRGQSRLFMSAPKFSPQRSRRTGAELPHGPLCSSGSSTGKIVSAMIAEPLAVGWMPSS